jgi:Mn2+/Fe2+ NRAMP family transporter
MREKLRRIFKRIGPGFIMASVVLGPGSITVSSSIGSTEGYTLLWLILLSAFFMAVYTSMVARFGVISEKSILQTMADLYGRWFSIIIGVSAFVGAASFQFGNNLGIGIGMKALTGIDEWVWALLFTSLAILFVFTAKNIYKVLEKMMMTMVLMMISAFFINLIFAKPDLADVAKGFLPISFSLKNSDKMAAIVATTFALVTALYQAHLVQAKGWKLDNLKTGLRDSYMGVAVLGFISMLIVITSAAALHPRGITINSAGDMAIQLEALFGSYSKYIFSFGLCAAAFSSLVVNPVVGGGLLADSFGLSKKMDDKWPKVFTLIVLLTGMIVAVFLKGNTIYALILAQAATLIGTPLIAIGIFMVLNNKKAMGDYVNTTRQNILYGLGFILIIVMFYFTIQKLAALIQNV